MRIRFAWIGILAFASVPVAPSLAANQSVTASNFVFTPADVTVLPGESVTWTNSGGIHNVHFEDGSFDEPPDATDVWPPIVSHTFNFPGTYKYYCEVHRTDGMTGTVTVQGPGTSPPQPVATDRVAPVLKLRGQGSQRVLRRRAVRVAVEVNEASVVVARATVAVPGAAKIVRTKEVTRHLGAGAKAKLKLGFTRPALRALRRAFRKRTRLTAKVTVIARDSAGNVRSAKRTIGLRGST